jgi:hypothetical protein
MASAFRKSPYSCTAEGALLSVHCVLLRSGRLGRGARRRAAGSLLERDRLGLAGAFSATASLTTSDFDAERVLRRRAGFVSDFESASIEAGAVAAVEGPAFALTL